MTVNDILEKIEELNKIRHSLKDIYSGCQELSSSESDTIFDAYNTIGEYIEELKKREVKE